MTSKYKIQDTVLKVSEEAKKLIPQIPSITRENMLLSELILCILSSQEKYEVALAVMKEFTKLNVLKIPKSKTEFCEIKSQIDNTLINPVCFTINNKNYSRRLRFYVKKTNYIINTIENIYFHDLTIKKILNQNICFEETRKSMISYSYGLGPKQASMFLRNIGYYLGFAVLDKHVIDYMKIMGLISGQGTNFSTINSYQKIEKKLKLYAESFNLNLFHLDLAIWTTMRTMKLMNI